MSVVRRRRNKPHSYCSCRELLENLIAPKPRRLNASDHDDLVQLLIEKDSELKEALKVKKLEGFYFVLIERVAQAETL